MFSYAANALHGELMLEEAPMLEVFAKLEAYLDARGQCAIALYVNDRFADE